MEAQRWEGHLRFVVVRITKDSVAMRGEMVIGEDVVEEFGTQWVPLNGVFLLGPITVEGRIDRPGHIALSVVAGVGKEGADVASAAGGQT